MDSSRNGLPCQLLNALVCIGLQVKSIIKGSEAEKNGRIQVGDEIIAVDGVSVRDHSLAGSVPRCSLYPIRFE